MLQIILNGKRKETMADVIKKSTNKFTKGLVMDFSPENTQNEVLTHALNATLLTFNGNELSLQNDMGNARVETVYLPKGYMPVGTCEYGGIIYIVSYNPLEDKSLIGCFPSPERNISRDELGEAITEPLYHSDFQETVTGIPTGKIKNNSSYVLLKNDELHPGDKFIVTSDTSIYDNSLADLYIKKDGKYVLKEHPIIALNIVSIEESGKIIYLTSDIKLYEHETDTVSYKYHILGETAVAANQPFDQQAIDIDSYRNVLQSGYSVFKLKTSGKLALLAELIMIDSYSVTHSLVPNDKNGFDIVLHHEVSPTVDSSNWLTVPKLQYFYLENSLGYLQVEDNGSNNGRTELFVGNDVNEHFLNTKLKDLFVSSKPDLFEDNQTLGSTGEFNFPKLNTYHGDLTQITGSTTVTDSNALISKFIANSYYRIDLEQVAPIDGKGNYDYKVNLPYYADLNALYYNYTENEKLYALYDPIPDLAKYNGELDKLNLYIKFPIDTYIPYYKFKPDEQYNWISGYTRPDKLAPEENAIILYQINDYIPQQPTESNYVPYDDIVLASIQIPEALTNNYLDIPFIYDYTIVPCMNYGHLDHLSVSNTIDFSNLHRFNLSGFNTWKYRIDGDLLRLTFGADIYDTYESAKVDGLLLEFYDLWGFAGSIEILDKKSYSGKFTKIIPLNTLKAIGNTRHNSTYLYNRNINISKLEDGTYKYNGITVLRDENIGWKIENPENNIFEETNDCGTLYSNMLYGVKAYLRRTKNGLNEYIEKEHFFLYTIPFFNDYYYTVDNFSNIESPELELALTYKLTDSSNITPYENANIKLGYTQLNYNDVQLYISGFYDGTELDVTKYYSYQGLTNLYLEIGLKSGYENWNLYYDPTINGYFSCDLKLINDDYVDGNETYLVKSDIEGSKSTILNYYEGFEPENYLTIDYNKNSNILPYNFINIGEGVIPVAIPINYLFIIGYKASIKNIRSTEIPATTICALFHKQEDESYNYSDFNIYSLTIEDSNYLCSDNVFYNSGSAELEILGNCRQINFSSNSLEAMQSILEYTQASSKILIPGKLNSGNPIKNLKKFIGKLAFCQPYVPGFLVEYGVNVIPNGDSEKKYYIRNDKWNYENVGRLTPTSYHEEASAKYICSLNTKDCLNYDSEFIATLHHEEEAINIGENNYFTCQKFTGFSGNLIAEFNQKLLQTMKSVYAYNPDYDSLPVNIGEVSIQDNKPIFTSNIISSNGKLSGSIKHLNDFIYLGSVKFSTYLTELEKHSKIDTDTSVEEKNKQLKIHYNLDYCGGGINPYLISTLTYKMELPKTLEQELEFNAKDTLVIKHSDGSNSFLTGTPNKKTLYGYDHDLNKLVQLDVSNYTIEEDGTLILTSKNVSEKETKNLLIEFTHESVKQLFSTSGYDYEYTFIGEDGKSTTTIINLKLEDPSTNKIKAFIPIKNMEEDTYDTSIYGKSVYVALDVSSDVANKSFTLKLKITPKSNSDFSYSVYDLKFDNTYKSRILKNVSITKSVPDYTKKVILDFTESTLLSMMYLGYYGIMLSDDIINGDNTLFLAKSQTDLKVKEDSEKITLSENTSLTNSSTVILFKIVFNKINLTIDRYTGLGLIAKNIIHITPTTNYSKFVINKYHVLDRYKEARFRGSSITINDLLYEPNQEEHRLFMKNRNYKVPSESDSHKLYFRTMSDYSKPLDEWSIDTQYLNVLHTHIGPCFTTDNL